MADRTDKSERGGGPEKENLQRAVSYLRKTLSKGYSAEDLKKTLLNYGYSRDVVEEAIKMTSKTVRPPSGHKAGGRTTAKAKTAEKPKPPKPEKIESKKEMAKKQKISEPRKEITKVPKKHIEHTATEGRANAKNIMLTHKLSNNMLYLETDIDKLYNWVKLSKSVRISTAARKFGVSQRTIRGWGEILEEHNLLEMHYPIMGKPILRIKIPKKKKKASDDEERGGKEKSKRHKKLFIFKLKPSRRLIIVSFLIGFFVWFFVYGLSVDTSFFSNFISLFAIMLSSPFLITVTIIIIVVIILSVTFFVRRKNRKKEKK